MKACARCKVEPTPERPLRGLYCVKCHNAYRQAFRLVDKAQRMGEAVLGFLPTIATRRINKKPKK